MNVKSVSHIDGTLTGNGYKKGDSTLPKTGTAPPNAA